jgi:hypothetical protein
MFPGLDWKELNVNPYRETPATPDVPNRSKARRSWRKRVCFGIVTATIAPTVLWAWAHDAKNVLPIDLARFDWLPCLAPLGLLALLVGVLPASNRDAKARLCRILWHRGDRGTAVGVYTGWVTLRYSKKRLARNAAALAAAQVAMPKHHGF